MSRVQIFAATMTSLIGCLVVLAIAFPMFSHAKMGGKPNPMDSRLAHRRRTLHQTAYAGPLLNAIKKDDVEGFKVCWLRYKELPPETDAQLRLAVAQYLADKGYTAEAHFAIEPLNKDERGIWQTQAQFERCKSLWASTSSQAGKRLGLTIPESLMNSGRLSAEAKRMLRHLPLAQASETLDGYRALTASAPDSPFAWYTAGLAFEQYGFAAEATHAYLNAYRLGDQEQKAFLIQAHHVSAQNLSKVAATPRPKPILAPAAAIHAQSLVAK